MNTKQAATEIAAYDRTLAEFVRGQGKEIKRLREALSDIEILEPDWMLDLDMNLERAKDIARAALSVSTSSETPLPDTGKNAE